MADRKQLQVRLMQPLEVQLALDWAGREGWNPGLNDAIAFYAADPNGFLVAEIDGEPIGCISAVRYGDRFGFIGLYIVSPQWRGRGYGMQLWESAWSRLLHRLDPERASIGLDGVVERESTYRKAGFQSAYRHVRHVCDPVPSERVPDEAIPLTNLPLDLIASYETNLFPASRPQFLKPWIQAAEAAYGIVECDRLWGYGVIRRCVRGFKIGPLFADTFEIAEMLFRSLIHHAEGQAVFIDIPDINSSASLLIERYNLQPVFTCVRMYWGSQPNLDVDRIFGVTTLELG
ncbi:GNAT family N-acetyltransferase [Altericista sp. CCNU0014]|uniref:GNAT family N-acetyltransferase n=1 Tax=Altericista sp. CCNU0014 TaxID=3082949 RepID=UPI00384DD1D7